MKYSIGEFSKLTGRSIKTIRYYHEAEILIPPIIDESSGYRYYNKGSIDKLKAILTLKNLKFDLKEIKDFMDYYGESKHIKKYLKMKNKEISKQIETLKIIRNNISGYISYENKSITYKKHKITKKHINDMYVAYIRFSGKYNNIPKYFKELIKNTGTYWEGTNIVIEYISKKLKNLHDLEIAIPISKVISNKFIKTKILKGGDFITLTHVGSHDTIPKSIKILIDYLKKEKLKLIAPVRQVDIKSCFSIIPQEKKDYITEIQFKVR